MTPIILLHGAVGAADQLEPLKEILSADGRPVYSFSFSGHGHSPFPADEFSIDTFSNELHAFILSHELHKPHVFGYSMGGYVALHLAYKHPDLLGKIATLGTKFKWDPETAHKEIKMLEPDTIQLKVPKFAEALKQRHGASWKDLLFHTSHLMIGLGHHPVLNDDVLENIHNPVMLGLGDFDVMVGLDETLHVRNKLENSSMYMLPNTKHPIESVNAGLLSQMLLSYFR
ncbi:MAG: alpha/beta fold hydrolase [Bacteroidetes bacterium]|nr:alpha/beta fold hydrolase [Bacteroidota bacterium]